MWRPDSSAVVSGEATVAWAAVIVLSGADALSVLNDKYDIQISESNSGNKSDDIKNVYNSIKDAPNYPEGFEPGKNI